MASESRQLLSFLPIVAAFTVQAIDELPRRRWHDPVFLAAGLLASDLILHAAVSEVPFAIPGFGFWAIVLAGLAGALAIVAGTMPLLARVTAPQSARME